MCHFLYWFKTKDLKIMEVFMKKRTIKIIIALILFIISLLVSFQNEYINKGIYIISYIIVRTRYCFKSNKKYF